MAWEERVARGEASDGSQAASTSAGLEGGDAAQPLFAAAAAPLAPTEDSSEDLTPATPSHGLTPSGETEAWAVSLTPAGAARTPTEPAAVATCTPTESAYTPTELDSESTLGAASAGSAAGPEARRAPEEAGIPRPSKRPRVAGRGAGPAQEEAALAADVRGAGAGPKAAGAGPAAAEDAAARAARRAHNVALLLEAAGGSRGAG